MVGGISGFIVESGVRGKVTETTQEACDSKMAISLNAGKFHLYLVVDKIRRKSN